MITTLHDTEVTCADGGMRLTAQVTYAPGTLPPDRITIEVEQGAFATPDESPLALVPAVYVLACRLSQDLAVDHPLPEAVHHGARQVGELLHRWYGWRPAELHAPVAPRHRRRPRLLDRRGIGVFFTRGVDSWGALLDRLDGPRNQRPSHLITLDNEVHIDPAIRAAVITDTQATADQLGLPLIVVRTDIRSVIDPHTDWGTQTHGSVLAGAGHLLQPTLREVVIAPTHWTPLLRPWGSHPDLDPCWSTPELTVTHHPGDESRWERVERIVARPEVASSLLVCWQGTSDRNCGTCEKCLRLMTSLEVSGHLERMADRFDVAFDPERINGLTSVSPHPWCDTIDHLDAAGLQADALRQRWEHVPRVARPMLWFQTREIQPRIAVVTTNANEVDEADAHGQVARHLATLGVRIDHQVPANPPVALHVTNDGDAILVAVQTPDGGTGGAIPLDDADLTTLAPLLDALDVDRRSCVPFDPDGQRPPPVVSEPAVGDWNRDRGTAPYWQR